MNKPTKSSDKLTIKEDDFGMFERSTLANITNAPSPISSTPLPTFPMSYEPTSTPSSNVTINPFEIKNSNTFYPSEIQSVYTFPPSAGSKFSLPSISHAPTTAATASLTSSPTVKIANKENKSKSAKSPNKSKEKEEKEDPPDPELIFIWGYSSTPSAAPTHINTPNNSKKLTTIIVPSLVVLSFLILFGFRFRRRHATKSSTKSSNVIQTNTVIQINDMTDISTLDGHKDGKTIYTYDPDNKFEPSLYSVDYDYTGVYNGPQSVSTAGATGLMTRKLQNIDPLVASTDIITIDVPPGKIGMLLIDDIHNLPPIVQYVKPDGVLCDKVHAGDKLLSVDEYDTSTMTTEQVCYIISHRSHQHRKLVFLHMDWL